MEQALGLHRPAGRGVLPRQPLRLLRGQPRELRRPRRHGHQRRQRAGGRHHRGREEERKGATDI